MTHHETHDRETGAAADAGGTSPVPEAAKRVTATITEPRVLRAMAHPARLAILDHLSSHEAATATECAAVCGLSPSATSYHLRELAKVGLVGEAPSRGDGRERLWRASAATIQVAADQAASAEVRSATLDLLNVVLTGDEERARAWFSRSQDEPPEWYDAASLVRRTLVMTADELRGVARAVEELLTPYLRTTRGAPPPEARTVAAMFRAFPTDRPPHSG